MDLKKNFNYLIASVPEQYNAASDLITDPIAESFKNHKKL
jgi:hypothetical protein